MVRITNNWIIVDNDDSLEVSRLKSKLTINVRTKIYGKHGFDFGVVNKKEPIFVEENKKLYIPRGLLFLIEEFLPKDIKDCQNKTLLSSNIEFNKEEIKNCLDGIVLSDEQFIAVRKILFAKRCLLQMSTGCFTGDTMVPLLNGEVVPFEKLINTDYKNEYVFCCSEDGEISFSKIRSVHITKYVNSLLEVTLDDNSKIMCTKEHPFMLRSGKYAFAEMLKPGDSLMPYDCFLDSRMDKSIRHNKFSKKGGRFYRGRVVVHRMVADKVGLNRSKGYNIHHVDNNHYNDNPENLASLKIRDHFIEHGSTDSERCSRISKENWERNGEYLRNCARNSIIKYNKSEKGRNESKRRAQHMRDLQRKYKDENPELYKIKRSLITYKSNCRRYHNNYPTNCEKCKDKFNSLIEKARKIDKNFESWNHKVLNIREVVLDEPIPVYDLETESSLHNFAIQTSFSDGAHQFCGSGVFVHNSGKTEVMCAVIKLLEKYLGKIPTTLILEPSSRLVIGTIDRLKRYNIDCASYNSNRKIVDNIVTVAHPKSLGNDLKKNDKLLDNVSVLFGDESHHLSSPSFRKPTYSMSNLEFSVGLSASAIEKNHVSGSKIEDFSMKELLIIGSTGKLVLNITAEHFINKGILAKPVLIRLNNPANESMGNYAQNNWHAVRDIKLESDKRVRLVAYTAKFFSDENRKVLILVSTTSWAEKIIKVLDEYNLSNLARCSFGGNVFMKCEDGKFVSSDEDVFDMYSKGKVRILIGTSHIYEGVDIPSLDTIILAYGGKGERLQVQGIGRALRKTKSGKYAYLIDFTDHEDIVLSKHSELRMTRYKELIGIPEDMIFDFVDIEDIGKIFISLER